MQSAIQIRSHKDNFTYIQCAYKERFKTLPKQSLACNQMTHNAIVTVY